MSNKVKKTCLFFCYLIILVAADQLTKLMAVLYLKDSQPFVIINGVLELNYVTNAGAAWGMLSGQRILFIVLTLVIIAVIIYAYAVTPWTKKYMLLIAAELLGISGAIGNFIDRCMNGYVHDFIYFKLIDFPVFNIADAYVVIAAAILIAAVLFVYKDEHDFDFLSIKKK